MPETGTEFESEDFKTQPSNIQDLRHRISNVCANINGKTIKKVRVKTKIGCSFAKESAVRFRINIRIIAHIFVLFPSENVFLINFIFQLSIPTTCEQKVLSYILNASIYIAFRYIHE